MRKTSGTKDFQIALLMDDISEAKALSDELREIGLFAHFYQTLDELWVSLNTYTPDLCIVDVKKMSQGQLLFKQHKKVKNNSLKFAFYYKNSTQVLLNSTFGMNHYGLIRKELNLLDQLKSVLQRRNEELRLIDLNETLTARIERLKMRGVRQTERLEKDNFTLKQGEMLKDLCAKFGHTNSQMEFMQRLTYVFSEWEACLEFGVYKLNSTKQKLTAPKISMKKYKAFPDLWLSSTCEDGISEYAVEMAFDVCYGIMDAGLSTIRVQGLHNSPDMLVIGQFDSEVVKNIDWSILEIKFAAEYRKALAKSVLGHESTNHIETIFETFQDLDDIQYHRADSKYRHVMVDFSAMVDMVKSRQGNRFYWKSFGQEFIGELTNHLSGDFRITNYGVECFIVSIEKRHIERDFNHLKTFVADFQFWRYFEDSSVVVSQQMIPDVRLLAPSSVNTIRQIHDGQPDMMESQIQRDRQIEV